MVIGRSGGVLFDLDGVLIDSAALITECADLALATLGLDPLSAPERVELIGPPLEIGFRELLARRGLDEAPAGALTSEFRRRYAPQAVTRTPLHSGIAELLDGLDGSIAMAVVTSKLEETAVAIIESLGIHRHFRAIAGGTVPPESKAEAILRVVTALGWTPASCWIVGDRHHDVEAGKACGVGTIGVTWGIGDEDELRRAGADVIVSTPETLFEFLAHVAEAADA